MSRYLLRYFFDPGSGVCLWSANDAARNKFSYPVNHNALSLSVNLVKQVNHIISWHDTAIDWESPANPSPWSDDERGVFNAAAQRLYTSLKMALGSDFDICDESNTKTS
jgi:hypothetical protein